MSTENWNLRTKIKNQTNKPIKWNVKNKWLRSGNLKQKTKSMFKLCLSRIVEFGWYVIVSVFRTKDSFPTPVQQTENKT